MSLLTQLLDLFYPPGCLACQKPLVQGEDQLCIPCYLELPLTNLHLLPENALLQTFMGRLPLQRAWSLLHFHKGGMVQQLLHRLKYRDAPEVGRYLGQLAAQRYAGEAVVEGLDGVLAVPLHPKKLRKRGYNQAACIAETLAAGLGLPDYSRQLIRLKNTKSQTRKSRFDRWENVQGQFALRSTKDLAHKHLLLVDDVLTTGATLEAAAQPLLDLNGVSLSVFTLAHAR